MHHSGTGRIGKKSKKPEAKIVDLREFWDNVGVRPFKNGLIQTHLNEVYLKGSSIPVLQGLSPQDAIYFASALDTLGEGLTASREALHSDRDLLVKIAILCYQMLNNLPLNGDPDPTARKIANLAVDDAIAKFKAEKEAEADRISF